MAVVVGKRVLGSIGAIFGASLITFVLMRILPGDPVRLIVGRFAPPSAVRTVTAQLGLNQPIFVQYGKYMSQFFQGHWGYSYDLGVPVTTAIAQRLPATIELGLFAFIITMVASIVLALLVTYRHRPVADRAVRGIAYLGFGTPQFFVAIILLLIFSSTLNILPGPEGRLSPAATPPPTVTHLYTVDALIAGQFGTFWEALRHLILPAIALGLTEFAFLVRLLRANLLEVSHDPYLTVARGKGLGRWSAFCRHALPNAFLPTLTVGGLLLGEFLAGSVLVEKVFDWPGVGALVVDAISRQDFAIVQAFILIAVIAFVVINLVVDLLYAVMDPRVRVATAS